MTEFGASFTDEVIYMGDAQDCTPEEQSLFIGQAQSWVDSEGIALGEGVVRLLIFSEGPKAYQMRAPRVSGPVNIVERVSRP